jgi:hypothetical protein
MLDVFAHIEYYGPNWEALVPTQSTTKFNWSAYPTFISERAQALIETHLSTENTARQQRFDQLSKSSDESVQTYVTGLEQLGWFKIGALSATEVARRVREFFNTLKFKAGRDSSSVLLSTSGLPDDPTLKAKLEQLIFADSAWRALQKIDSGKVSSPAEMITLLKQVGSKHESVQYTDPKKRVDATTMATNLEYLVQHWQEVGIGIVENTGFQSVFKKTRPRTDDELTQLLRHHHLYDTNYNISSTIITLLKQLPTTPLERSAAQSQTALERYHTYTIALPGSELSIGRTKENGAKIIIPDNSISRQHARVTAMQKGEYTLADLDSTNGTYLNGLRLNATEEMPLMHGDRIKLGNSPQELLVHINAKTGLTLKVPQTQSARV